MIRRLHAWEIEDVTTIAEAFYAEANMGGAFNKVHFEESLQRASAIGALYLGGRFSGDVLVGVLAGSAHPNLMSGELVAQELFWYVLPEHRGGMDGIRMLRDFETWAADAGAKHIFMAHFHSQQTGESVAALYERLGYKPVETHHLKSL